MARRDCQGIVRIASRHRHRRQSQCLTGGRAGPKKSEHRDLETLDSHRRRRTLPQKITSKEIADLVLGDPGFFHCPQARPLLHLTFRLFPGRLSEEVILVLSPLVKELSQWSLAFFLSHNRSCT